MDVEVSVSDSRAQARAVTMLQELGHEASSGPKTMNGRHTVRVIGVREGDLAVLYRVVAAVDRPVVAAVPAA